MDQRIKHRNPERDAQLRQQLFDGVARQELTLAQAVRAMQKLSQLTQPEFAAHRGISVQALKQILSGKGNPTVETLNKIGAVFGLQVGFVAKKPAQK
jgi:DNA-binding XRE family transcriptional regulator